MGNWKLLTYKCDHCKKTFKGSEIRYEEPSDNVEILTPPMPFVFLMGNGKPGGGSKMADKEKGDKLLTCPHCEEIHLFGFNLVDPGNDKCPTSQEAT